MADSARLIDITLPLTERLPVWPGDAPMQIARTTDFVTVSELRLSSHAGTHLDAPAHFFPGGKTVDQIALQVLIGPAWVCDCGDAATITADLLATSAIPPAVHRLLLKTTNSNRPWLQHDLGTAGPIPFDTGFVGLDQGSGQWLLDQGIRLVGMDGPSADPFASDFSVHRLLLGNNVVIVENLDLRVVQPGAYRLICLPLPYAGGDGAPVRAVLETFDSRSLSRA